MCSEFDVTQLADHLIGSVTSLATAAGGSAGHGGSTLEDRVATAAQAMLEAWAARGVDGTVKLGPHEMPAGLTLGIGSIEFLVHAWDFAQVTGQQVDRARRSQPSMSWTWPASSSHQRSARAGASPTRSRLDRTPACSTGSSPSPAARHHRFTKPT